MTEAQLRKEIAARYELPSCLIKYFNTDKNENKSIEIVIEKETEKLISKLNTEYFRTPKLNGELPAPALRLERLKSRIKIKKAYFIKKNYNFLRYVVEKDEVFLEAASEAEVKKGLCEWVFVRMIPHQKNLQDDVKLIRQLDNSIGVMQRMLTSNIEARESRQRAADIFEAIANSFRQMGIPFKKIKISYALNSIFDKASPVECDFISTHFKELISKQSEELEKEVHIIKGELIRYYYDHRTYEEETGSIGNSCMRYWNLKYRFDLYCKNSNVELITLINPTTKKLKARAVLWTIHTGEKVIDRIFSIDESSKRKLASYAVTKGIKTFSSINSTIPLYQKLGIIYLDDPCKNSSPYLDSTHFRDEYFNAEVGKYFIASNLSERSEIQEKIRTVKGNSSNTLKDPDKILDLLVKDIAERKKYEVKKKVFWKLSKDLEWEPETEDRLAILSYKANNISLKDIFKAALNKQKITTAEELKQIVDPITREEIVKILRLYSTGIDFLIGREKSVFITYNDLLEILKTTTIHKEKIKLFSFSYWPVKLTEEEVKYLSIDGKKTMVPKFVNEVALINLLKLVRDTKTLKSIEITSLKSLLNISKGCREKCLLREDLEAAYRAIFNREKEYKDNGYKTRTELRLELDTERKVLHVKAFVLVKEHMSGYERKVRDIGLTVINLNTDAKYGEVLKALAGIKKAKAEKPVKSVAHEVYESLTEENLLEYFIRNAQGFHDHMTRPRTERAVHQVT